MPKEILLTGMRPTSNLHVGNYFGALAPVVEYQKKYKTFLMVADIHALTTLKDTADIRDNTLKVVMMYLAAGIDPKQVTLFVQSEIPEQVELATLLGMLAPVSMLELNPVYKEMLAENPHATNLGLLSYPVLQTADILAYKASSVPVGRDQLPHLELSREIARRFNAHHGTLFPEPRGLVGKELKILSLQDSSKKMSKSHSENSQISLLDKPNEIRKKIKIAMTDSESSVLYSPEEKPAISNLIVLMHLASGESIRHIEQRFSGKGYGEFKNAVADALTSFLAPLQNRYHKLSKNKKAVEKILHDGSKKARFIAARTLTEAKKKIGLF